MMRGKSGIGLHPAPAQVILRSMSDSSLEQRIVELELRYSFLAEDFESLHQAVLELAETIDRHHRLLHKLEGKMDRLGDDQPGEEPPPPHY